MENYAERCGGDPGVYTEWGSKEPGEDYENPFRKRIFRNDAEQKAVLGSILDNSFVKQVEEETRQFNERVARAGFGGGFYATK
jgi:hypothetical protein